MDTLDEELRQADPVIRLRREETATLVAAMADMLHAQPLSKTRWWKNWRIAVPVAAVGVMALTGAAVVAPLLLGDESGWVDLDARIPITYTTDSGVTVSCMYGLHVSSAAGRTAEDERLAEILASEDWTGIGQEIYDHAIANPIAPQEGEVWERDNPEVRDAISFKLAFTPVVSARLPADLRDAESGWSTTDTCTGPFR